MSTLSRWFTRWDAACPDAVGGVEAAREKTMRLSTIEGSGYSVMQGCGENFFSAFAIFLKAGNLAMAVLASAPILLGALAQLLSARWIDRFQQRRRFLRIVLTLQAFAYAPLFLVPLLFPFGAAPVAIAFALFTIFLSNMGQPVWTSLIGDVVPEARRGDYFGRRFRVIMFVLASATLAGGLLLATYQQLGWVWAGFGVLFGIAGLARYFAAQLFPLHYEPAYQPTADDFFSLWDFVRRTPRSNFARFTFYAALINFGANIAAPFFPVYMLRDLHWSYTQFTVNAITMLIAQVVFVRWWGRVSDRHGNRAVLIATSCLLPSLPVFWALTGNFYLLLGAQVISGATWSGYNLATQNFLLDSVTPRKRALVMSYYSLINGIFVLIGGVVLGAWLANHLPSTYHLGPLHCEFVSSLPAVFIISGLIRLIVLLTLAPTFREVRNTEPVYPGTLLLRLWSGEAVTGVFWEVTTRISNVLRRRG
ncbi:MAG: MFS transporter [Verrucomicrobia bacterium]|nr:MAG: MFS transporter [Verrucomicrobiota bacterium]